MTNELMHIITWGLGMLGAVLVFLYGMNRANTKEHMEIHDKIDDNHHAIRDRLDAIWKHLSTKE